MASGLLSPEDREDTTIRTRAGTTAAAGLLLAAGWLAGCASRPAPPREPPPETATAPSAPAEAGVETARRAEEELERVEPPAKASQAATAEARPAPDAGRTPPPDATARHEALSGRELLYVVEIPFAGGATRPGPAARTRLGQLAERLALGDAAFALELQVAAGRLSAARARAVSDDLARRGWRGFHAVTVVPEPSAPPREGVRVLVLR